MKEKLLSKIALLMLSTSLTISCVTPEIQTKNTDQKDNYTSIYYVPYSKGDYEGMPRYLIKKYPCIFGENTEEQITNFLTKLNNNPEIPIEKGYQAIPEYNECQ